MVHLKRQKVMSEEEHSPIILLNSSKVLLDKCVGASVHFRFILLAALQMQEGVHQRKQLSFMTAMDMETDHLQWQQCNERNENKKSDSLKKDV